ncbi:MAG TPA: glycosyl transferase family 1 [Planctomycetes bacterium]|nr:glycosyl transferase family 1 [Planctomycetota bacterium]
MSAPLLDTPRVTEASAAAPLDVAIAGTRGVPANYSGFETFAEELGARLVERGHRVTVYGRVPYVGRQRRRHRGIEVVPVRGPRGKHLETPCHTLLSAFSSLRRSHDVVLLCNAANAFALPLFGLRGAATAINVDGVDRLRRKWGRLGRLWFWAGERLSLRWADQPLTDATCLRDYYREVHEVELPVIAYGGERGPLPGPDHPALTRHGLRAGDYALVVGRLEPENNALAVVEAYRDVPGDHPLVVVGDAPYADAYKAQVRAAADRRVVFTGGVYGEGYLALMAYSACYVAAGEVGGTHPALVEAMTFGGGPIVANDVPEHREVLGESALFYVSRAELSAALARCFSEPERGAELRAAARARADERYRWDAVTDAYEALFHAMARQSQGARS